MEFIFVVQGTETYSYKKEWMNLQRRKQQGGNTISRQGRRPTFLRRHVVGLMRDENENKKHIYSGRSD